MYLIGVLISVLVTAGLAGAVALLGVTTLLGAVRGPAERAANRPWYRLFMGLVAVGLFMLAAGMLWTTAQMLGILPDPAHIEAAVFAAHL